MMTRAMPRAAPNLTGALISTKAPMTLASTTLLAKKKVIVTEARRRMFAQPFCGDPDMNCGSLRHTNRHSDKNGRRQPLNTWAIWMILVLSEVALTITVDMMTISHIIPW